MTEGGAPGGGALGLRRQLPNAAFLFGSTALQAGAAFAANLVLVRFITPEGFGRYALALATITLVFAVLSLRMNVLVIRTSDDALDRGARTLFFNAIVQETLVVGCVGGLWLAASGLLDAWTGALVVSFVLRHFSDHCKAFYERGMQYAGLARVEGGSMLLAHALSVGLVLAGAGPATLYVRDLVLSALLVVGLQRIGGLPRLPLRLVRPGEWVALARQARGIWADGMLSSSFRRLVVLLAGWFGGEAGAGYFFQAQRLAGVPHQIIDPVIGRLSLNWFSRQEESRARRRARDRMLLVSAVPLALAAALTVLYADRFVPFLLGDRWASAVPVLVAMVGFVLFASLFETLKMYFFAVRQARLLFLGRVAQYAGLAVPLALAFARGTGDAAAVGLAVSTAYASAFAVGLWLAWRAGRRA